MLSPEQSQKNFNVYEKKLNEVASKYNLQLDDTTDSNYTDETTHKDLRIFISDNEEITIHLVNSAVDSSNGSESFEINYFLNTTDSKHQFNIQLFTELSNCISGKTISEELCNDFLSSPESKYSAEDYGFEKLNGEIISKMYPLNFEEDWTVFYTMEENGNEILTFGGLTLQLSE